MNITNLITSLQQAATAATTPAEYAILSKAIQKLNVGKVTTVATSANLPINLTTNGNIYYVTGDEAIYYNVGATWKSFYTSLGIVAYAWGEGNNGRLGDNTTTDTSSPVTVVGGITNWSQVSAGTFHSLGLTSTGIAYAWGSGSSGQLGDNTIVGKSSPVTVVGGITNWSQVSASENHSLGLTSTGIAYAWGGANNGKLGDDTTTSKSSPVTVVGGITTWSKISAGYQHSLGVTSDGIAYGWGRNANAQLGDDTTTASSSPVTVVGGITTWSQLAFGRKHSLGVTSTGIAYGWGYNGFKQLGDNTSTNRSSPVTVVGGITTWSQVSGGMYFSLGLTSTGIAYGWGYNSSGQIGDGTTVDKQSPVTVVGGITNWSQVSGGRTGSRAVTSAGIAYGWGSNVSGTLGDNTTTGRSSPVAVVGGITNWSQVSASHGDGSAQTHSLGITAVAILNTQAAI